MEDEPLEGELAPLIGSAEFARMVDRFQAGTNLKLQVFDLEAHPLTPVEEYPRYCRLLQERKVCPLYFDREYLKRGEETLAVCKSGVGHLVAPIRDEKGSQLGAAISPAVKFAPNSVEELADLAFRVKIFPDELIQAADAVQEHDAEKLLGAGELVSVGLNLLSEMQAKERVNLALRRLQSQIAESNAQTLCQHLVDAVIYLTKADYALVLLMDDNGSDLASGYDQPHPDQLIAPKRRLLEGIAEWVKHADRPVTVPDIGKSAWSRYLTEEAVKVGSLVGLPIPVRDGRETFGAIVVGYDRPRDDLEEPMSSLSSLLNEGLYAIVMGRKLIKAEQSALLDTQSGALQRALSRRSPRTRDQPGFPLQPRPRHRSLRNRFLRGPPWKVRRGRAWPHPARVRRRHPSQDAPGQHRGADRGRRVLPAGSRGRPRRRGAARRANAAGARGTPLRRRPAGRDRPPGGQYRSRRHRGRQGRPGEPARAGTRGTGAGTQRAADQRLQGLARRSRLSGGWPTALIVSCMKVLIAGGTGFIGRHLTASLTGSGHEVVVLGRGGSSEPAPAGVRRVTWDPRSDGGEWESSLKGADGVVNLAGASIGSGRWTGARMAEIVQSRLDATGAIVRALGRAGAARPAVLVNASGIDYYGDRGDEMVSEQSPPGDSFLAHVSEQWEAAARKAEALPVRVVLMRTALVFGREALRLSLDGSALQGLRRWAARQRQAMVHLDPHR